MTNRDELVPVGAYKGEPWERVSESYLYYVVNRALKEKWDDMRFANGCRREIVRRLKGEDPWAKLPTNK